MRKRAGYISDTGVKLILCAILPIAVLAIVGELQVMRQRSREVEATRLKAAIANAEKSVPPCFWYILAPEARDTNWTKPRMAPCPDSVAKRLGVKK